MSLPIIIYTIVGSSCNDNTHSFRFVIIVEIANLGIVI